MNKLRVISITLLILAGFILVLPVFGKGKGTTTLTSGQQKAKSKCSLQYMNCVDGCGVVGLNLAYWPCQEKCQTAYNKCMDAAGIPRDMYPPPKTDGRRPATGKTGVTAVGTVTPTPHKPTMSPERTDSVAPVKGGTATPTPTPRPKTTSSPLKKSNG